MFCLGWSTGVVVSDLSCKVAKTVISRINIDKTARRQLFSKRKSSIIQKSNMGSSQSSNKSNNQTKNMAIDEEYYDRVVCKNEDINEGQFKEIKLDDEGKVSGLLIKQNGQLSALSNKCTHYGANLATVGSLGDGIIRCPWHGACFNIASGDIEDFPGLDSLNKYEVNVTESGEIRVRAKKSCVDLGKRTKKMCKKSEEETIIIVGGGGAAQSCAETLRSRENPWKGRIIMMTKENSLPYDRPKLSKSMSSTPQDLSLRKSGRFYDDADIEVMKNTEVMKVDSTKNAVVTQSGEVFNYNYLVLATGGTPRTLDFAKGISNIFLLRTPEDGNAIVNAAKEKNVVIIGASFIGMEVAAHLSDKAASVTVVGNVDIPFKNSLGPEIGSYIKQMHLDKGVKFLLETNPTEFVANEDGAVEKVILGNGEEIDADVVVLGIGVVPTTSYIKDEEIKTDSRGFIIVNDCLKTNVDNIYAAGDIIKFPLNLRSFNGPRLINVGHWQTAKAHGRCAALNIATSDQKPLQTVPFFWTVQYGKSIRYAGVSPDGYDDIVYDGEVVSGKFVAFYIKNDIVVAVATLGRDPVAADFANFLLEGNTLKREDIADETWRNKYSLSAKI